MTDDDFEGGDIPLAAARPGSFREFIAIAKWPLLAMAPSRKAIDYTGFEHGKRFQLHIEADDPDLGMATLHDGNVLVWVATKLAERMNTGGCLQEPLTTSPNEMLRLLRQPTGGAQCKALRASLRRLANTAVNTDLAPHGARHLCFFTLLERIELPPLGQRGAWRITPAGWLIEQAQHQQLRKLEPAMQLLRGLESRVAAWGRAHAGGRGFETYRLSFRRAYGKAASADTPRRFRHALRELIHKNAIPGFALALEQAGGDEILVIHRLARHRDTDTSGNAVTAISLGLNRMAERAEPEVIDLVDF